MFLFLTYYFQVNLGYTPLKAGFAFLPFSLGIIFAAGFVSQLLPRLGPRALILPGLVMAIVGMLLLTQIDQDSNYWFLVFPSMVIMSVGLAGVFIPAASTSLIGVQSHDAGVASAVLNTSQQIGGSLGTALLNTLFAGAVTAYFTDHPPTSPDQAQQILPLAFIHGYHVAFVWGAVLFAAALVASFVFITAHKEDIPDPAAVADPVE
jgi:MFS family permease